MSAPKLSSLLLVLPIACALGWVSPAGASGPGLLEPAWSYYLFGNSLGNRFSFVVDVGNDGRSEVISESGEYLSLIGWPEGAVEPYVLSQSLPLGSSVSDMAVWRNGNQWRVAVLLLNDDVIVLELPSFEVVASGPATLDALELEVADVVGGPASEIILVGSEGGAVYDSTTIEELLTLPYSGWELAVGNVDSDPAVELVFGGGEVVEIRNGTTVLEWVVPMGGDTIILEDLDASPPLEIVMGDTSNLVAAFAFGNPNPWWGYPGHLFSSADLTRDGTAEILIIDGIFNELTGLHPTLGTPIWTENYSDEYCDLSPAGPITMAGDIDGDGDGELIWPGGSYDYRKLCVADAWSGDLIFRSAIQQGPVRAVASGDLDGDGTVERIAIDRDLSLVVFDAGAPTPRSRVWLSDGYGPEWSDEVAAVDVGDVDRDGAVEVVVAIDGYHSGDGAIHEYDGLTLEHERGEAFGIFSEVSAIDIADLDNDGWPEIAFGGGGSTLTIGAVEGATGELEWSVAIDGQGSTAQAVEVADVDADQVLEIVAVGTGAYSFSAGSIVIVDADTHDVRWSPVQGFFGLDLVDVDGDGTAEILTGSEAGEIVALEGGDPIAELWRIPVAPTRLVGVRSYVDHTGGLMAAASTDDAILGVDLATGVIVWTTPVLGESVGRFDALEAVTVAGETTPGFLVGALQSMHEIRPSDLIVFCDGFESGNTERWSDTQP
ncbi:MAG: FG-GAP-like repeat-containing protein [Thermoanaerobaculales bacterium]|nr:FG-GAP-like repeat-containing protein [Thermoanaerobaculales bacterium]